MFSLSNAQLVPPERAKTPYQPPRWLTSRWMLATAAVLSAGVLLIDSAIPATSAPAVFYTGILVLLAFTRRGWLIIPAAILFTLMTWVGWTFKHPGEPMWISLAARCIVCGVIWLMAQLMLWRERDLDALEQALTELARRNHELDQFAARIAHDIRSPLTTAVLYAGMLPDPGTNPEDDLNPHDVLMAALSDMNDLTRDLLESARHSAQEHRCDAERAFQCVVRSMDAEVKEAGAKITHEPLPVVGASDVHVRLLLQNLIQNSLKFRTWRAPSIHVWATREGTRWQFSVRDNGIGIGTDEAERIFERFGRGDASGDKRGVGLGLATCRSIVEQYGGRIWVDARVEAGALFCFTLPVHITSSQPMLERSGAA